MTDKPQTTSLIAAAPAGNEGIGGGDQKYPAGKPSQTTPISLRDLVDRLHHEIYKVRRYDEGKRFARELPVAVYLGYDDIKSIHNDREFYNYCSRDYQQPTKVLCIPVVEVCLETHCEILWRMSHD